MILETQSSSGDSANRGENFDGYAMGDRKERETPPRQIDGTFRPVFVAMVRDFARVSRNPMTSFNYGCQELLIESVAVRIMHASRAFITFGLKPTDVVWLGVLHRKGAGTNVSTDMHSAVLNFLLSSEVRWNPYFEGKDRATFVAFTELINYAFDLASAKDPARRKLAVSPPGTRDPGWLVSWKLFLTDATNERFREDPFIDREAFAQFVRNLEDVSRVTIDGKVLRAVVRDTEVLIKGALAGEWFYTDPDRYQRKSKQEYVADFERGLKARLSYHRSLADSHARHPSLAWMQLVPVESPIAPLAVDRDVEVERQYSFLTETLGLKPKKLKTRHLTLGDKIRATTAMLFSSPRPTSLDLKAKAKKKGFSIEEILSFGSPTLAMSPNLPASSTDEEEADLLKELQSVIEAWNTLDLEKRKDQLEADNSPIRMERDS
jgi:hypothetical protein